MSKTTVKPQLIAAPRLYMNLAILVGGIIGLIVQDQQNMGSEQAFILTGFSCFMAVLAVNIIWLIKTRLQERKQTK